MTTPGLYITHLVCPKDGHSADECEDAVCVLPALAFDELVDGPVAASVCDGASESVLAKDWAQLLASASAAAALHHPGFFGSRAAFEDFAGDVVDSWDPWLDNYIHQRDVSGKPLKWYEQSKLRGSTFATFLSVRVTPTVAPLTAQSDSGPTGTGWLWHAAALGDSCLFHIRDERMLRSFPVQHCDEFGTSPDLFGSRNRDTALLAERTRFDEGHCLPGDRLLLMSDALAAWFMAAPRPDSALQELLEFGGPHDATRFSGWLDDLRARHELRNDDVALIRIDFEGK